MTMAKRSNKAPRGWKRYGHRSHVSASRMRLDSERLQSDARRMERRYTKPRQEKEGK